MTCTDLPDSAGKCGRMPLLLVGSKGNHLSSKMILNILRTLKTQEKPSSMAESMEPLASLSEFSALSGARTDPPSNFYLGHRTPPGSLISCGTQAGDLPWT
jgi:hypothetical protein